MKLKNIKFTAQALFSNGTDRVRVFVTEQAVSNWANKMFRKDEGVTVNVYYFCTDNLYCSYHA